MSDDGRCPRCKGPLNLKRPVMNALSRWDNATAVCSPCGQAEAMWDFVNRGKLPPVTERIAL